VSALTRTPRLALLPTRSPKPSRERLRLEPSQRLSEFLEASAQVGLDAPLAVRLALERALVLHEAQDFRLDVERVRRILSCAAAEARASRPLSARQAGYIRRLCGETRLAPVEVQEGLSVPIPDDLLTRALKTVPETVLHQDAVLEMLSWERAARLEGRTMLEWALKAIAGLIIAR
jgi:hypothetical protein